ncbi:hypothetical protein [Bacteroides sp. 224]|uniref:hypothetical protein n=1 Tax=Bacteroides sp. 224 TaxID=2302936 RepID=UPI0013D565AF|nr:hypothetical protein [Bacteroides sp. 224]NDV66561.1 hypothetical protein [Bacteroides sp. 224]
MKLKLPLLLILFPCMQSCSQQILDKNTIVVYDDNILLDYSYKGYEIHPFIYREYYTMPFTIGDEWLVYYLDSEFNPIFKEHQIVDSIRVRNMSNNPCNDITIPVFEDGSASSKYYLDRMIFFKGFKTYNTNMQNKIPADFSYDIKESNNTDEISRFWKLNGKSYCYTNRALKKKGRNEITFSVDSKKQVLFRRYAEKCSLGNFKVHRIEDYDGDGLSDLIIRAWASNGIGSFLLFLSSEADEGELVKHVATKTVGDRKYLPTTENESTDEDEYEEDEYEEDEYDEDEYDEDEYDEDEYDEDEEVYMED